ncbi:hypothetical protein PQU92_10160 [Asticcacaulis sp. BYS171W]|uniref:Uncharacterized protein n=1 Tax=Asticcacaulis aquaticus TaxID=2984212 RepID=A0ABT5HU94_9CAUL|nr:hypothetical protein [Asticcacaulis aquaticus]MDC7683642.1 hypothetical protein [Asticcacaulis aquaticus]
MISRWFLRLAVVFGLIGMGMGVAMGATHDFVLAPVHAHINLVGWVGMFLAGLFYAAKPEAETTLARVHLVGLTLGLCLLAPGIAGAVLGIAALTPLAIAGSIVTFASMALFVGIVFRHTGPAKA